MACITACSETNEGENPLVINPEDGLPVMAKLDTRAIPDQMTCLMHVFWKPTGPSDYVYKEVVSLTNLNLPYTMKFVSQDLVNKSYRFLFVAIPTVDSKINILNDQNEALSVGNSWSEVIISSQEQELKGDYYYDVLDMTGDEIKLAGNINGNLERLVGQMVLDIFRGEDIDTPVGVKSGLVASVIDRVYQIDIDYSNLTKEISFKEDGSIQEKTNWDDAFVQTITPVMGDTLQVLVDSSEGIARLNENAKGAVRIKGVYALTSSAKVRAKYTFKYYDTTPTCGSIEKNHKHTVECFENNRRELVLHLPKQTEEVNLLSILPNHYTVNKAGIKLDRIIDLASATSFDLDMDWANENIENE